MPRYRHLIALLLQVLALAAGLFAAPAGAAPVSRIRRVSAAMR
jgi:hypothetical protein